MKRGFYVVTDNRNNKDAKQLSPVVGARILPANGDEPTRLSFDILGGYSWNVPFTPDAPGWMDKEDAGFLQVPIPEEAGGGMLTLRWPTPQLLDDLDPYFAGHPHWKPPLTSATATSDEIQKAFASWPVAMM